MTQDERRVYLLKSLLSEKEEYEKLTIPESVLGQKRLLRALFNVRAPAPVSQEFLDVQDAYLKEATAEKGVTDYHTLTPVRKGIWIWQGDITTLACGAIVNAANSQMLGCFNPGHGCIDNIIHTYAGVELRLRMNDIMREQGHEVINVDLKDSDISANLATKEGRDEVIQKIHELHPEGIDGLCCNAGVSGACGNVKLMVSLNYFGATNLAHGLFDLLKKKGGNCVVTSSNTISQGAARMDLVDMLNYSQTKPINEERILNILDDFDGSDLSVGNSIYVTTKYALARWARRVSASWAANGVRINTVAPGNVSTPMTATMSENAKAALAALPIPINYGTDELMHPEDIANVIVFLVSPLAHGINGNVMFVDGGTDALLNSEKVY